MRHNLAVLLATALLGVCQFSFALDIGAEAPAFSLPGLRKQDGTALINLSNFRGKVVYVDFWASWCGPCVVSTPLLNELRNRLVKQGKAFEVVAINVDKKPADGIDFLSDQPVQYIAVSDPAGTTPASYQVKGMPTGFLLDQSGKIRLIHQGFKTSDIKMIEAEAEKLLAGKP